MSYKCAWCCRPKFKKASGLCRDCYQIRAAAKRTMGG
jgi:hypothetical protein